MTTSMTTSAYCNHIASAAHEDRFFFEGTVKHGRGTRSVQVIVDAHIVVRLAEIMAVAKHAGHAVWHYKNPQHPLPCETCGK